MPKKSKVRKSNKEKSLLAFTMRQQGHSVVSIADRLKTTERTVYRWLKNALDNIKWFGDVDYLELYIAALEADIVAIREKIREWEKLYTVTEVTRETVRGPDGQPVRDERGKKVRRVKMRQTERTRDHLIIAAWGEIARRQQMIAETMGLLKARVAVDVEERQVIEQKIKVEISGEQLEQLRALVGREDPVDLYHKLRERDLPPGDEEDKDEPSGNDGPIH